MKLPSTSLLAAALAALPLAAAAASFTAVVTRVSDGDTLWLRADDPSAKPFKLRLQGIDAPERCQPWGPEAAAALAERVLLRQVQVHTRARDDYQRSLGNIHLGDEDISAWMVAQGHAWSYRYRRHGGPYAAQEDEARARRRGLFADGHAMEPRLFRQMNGPCDGARRATSPSPGRTAQ